MKTLTTTPKQSFATYFKTFFASNTLFYGIVALLIIQASWIALSGRYPMAFDEDFHLGIIRIYAHHLSPFLNGQPAGANAFGAVARDPSYIYQYLMSFPYRLITVFTKDQTIEVLALRFVNIGLFTLSLPIFRRLLRLTSAGEGLINCSMLVFVLVPIVPFLAAQINYDNLFIPMVGLTLLIANRLNVIHQERRIPWSSLVQLLILCLLSSVTKYAFLPIFLLLIILVPAVILHQFGWRQMLSLPSLRRLVTSWSWRRHSWLAIALCVSALLFGQRYIINTIDYHTPLPDCNQVLTVQACSAYGPWIRDYNLAKEKKDNAPRSPITFSGEWFYGMWLRSYFAVDGPALNFQTDGPFIVPAVGVIVFSSLGAVLTIVFWRRIWQRYDHMALALGLLSSSGYLAAVWLDDYREYLQTGQPEAINGRYLLPVLLLLILLIVMAYNEALRKIALAKYCLAVVVLLTAIWGGGVLTYILRSNNGWDWPNQTVLNVNDAVRRVIGPVVPGYRHPGEFLGHN
jgi:hypothetical protein